MTFLYIDMFNIYLLHNTVLTFIYYYFKSSKTVEYPLNRKYLSGYYESFMEQAWNIFWGCGMWYG